MRRRPSHQRRHQHQLLSSDTQAQALKREAIGWFSADDITTGTEQSLPNRAVDPLYIASAGSGANIHDEGLVLMGTADNYASSDAAAATNDIKVYAHIVGDDYALGTDQGLVADWTGTDHFRLYILPDGRLHFGATTASELTLTAAAPLTNGLPYWVQATYKSSSGMTLEYAPGDTAYPDAVWTSVTGHVGEGNLTHDISHLAVGSYDDGGGLHFVGTVREVHVSNYQDTKVHASPDFSSQTLGAETFTDEEGVLWTIHTSGHDVIAAVGPLVRGATRGSEIIPNGVYLPAGLANNNASTSDSSAVSITGDIDVRIKLDEFSALPNGYLAGKISGGSDRSWRLYRNPPGTSVQFQWSVDGSTLGTNNSRIVPALSNEWLRFTLDVDNGAGQHVVSSYTSTDGETWGDEESTTYAGTTSIYDSVTTLMVGSAFAGAGIAPDAVCSAFELRDGIDGTVVASPDFAAQLPGTLSFDDAQGNTWTINSTGVDTSDPMLATAGLYLPGLSASDASGPAAPDGNYDIVVLSATISAPYSAAGWDYASSNQAIVAAWNGGSADSLAMVRLNPNGKLNTQWRHASGYTNGETPTALPDEHLNNLPVRVTIDTTVSPQTGTFEYFVDGWQTLDVVEFATPTSPVVADSSVDFRIGGREGGTIPFEGNVSSASITLDGSNLSSPDFRLARPGDTTLTDEQGNLWTLHGDAQFGPVTIFDGTDDYMQSDYTPDVQVDGDTGCTLYIRSSSGDATSFARLIGGESGNNNGPCIRFGSSGLVSTNFGDGTTSRGRAATGSPYNDSVPFTAVMSLNGATLRFATSRGYYSDIAVTGSGIGTVTHGPIRVMARAYTLTTTEGEVFEVLIWDRALTQTEMEALVA